MDTDKDLPGQDEELHKKEQADAPAQPPEEQIDAQPPLKSERQKPQPQGGTDGAEGSHDLKYENTAQRLKGGVLGIFIGLAVIIPGVSGSAVAIIMKLYEKLLYAIGNILRSFKKCFWFLLPIAIGAAAGFIVGFFAVKLLLEVMMFAVVALFAGLMAGAFPAVKDELKGEKHTPLRIALKTRRHGST